MINLKLTHGEWYFLHRQLENIIKENPNNRITDSLLEKIANSKPNLNDIKSEFEMEYETTWVDGEELYILPSNPNHSVKIVFEDDVSIEEDKEWSDYCIRKIIKEQYKRLTGEEYKGATVGYEVLREMGISVMDNKGEFRGVEDILRDIADIWKDVEDTK